MYAVQEFLKQQNMGLMEFKLGISKICQTGPLLLTDQLTLGSPRTEVLSRATKVVNISQSRKLTNYTTQLIGTLCTRA